MGVTKQLGDNLGIWGKNGDNEDSSHGPDGSRSLLTSASSMWIIAMHRLP
jgi:hypothetical protein